MDSTTSVEDVSGVVLQLTDTLGPEFDLAGLLYQLAIVSVELLDIDAAAVLLLDEQSRPVAVSATHRSSDHLEQLQARTDGGPSVDSVRLGEAVFCADLEQEGDRWPGFNKEARHEGFRAVHAVPLSLHADIVGGLNLFRRSVGVLSDVDRRTAVLLATAAATGLLHRRAVRRLDTVNGQLRQALESRVVIEQAKGFLAARLGVTPEVGFDLLRAYARPRRERLTGVAQGVLDGCIEMA